ncbi:AAA family ATPase [Mycolicibacterium sp. XJ662]
MNSEYGKQWERGTTPEISTPKLWRAADLKPAARLRWLANKWIPRGAPTVLCGDEGIGKTLFDIRVVAAVTTGTPLPDVGIPKRDPQHVLLAAITEEDWSTIVLPRLEVAGADLDMVRVICSEADGSGAPVFPRDFDLIREMDPKPALIVVDSWLDTLAMDMVVRDSQSAARALAPWTDLATKTDAGIILLTPTNRLATGDVRERYGATQHLRKKARMTLFAVRDDDTDFMVIGPDKANVTKPVRAAMYRVTAVDRWEPAEDDDGTVGRLDYVTTTDRTIREWVTDTHEQANDGDDDSALTTATNWLREYLTMNWPQMDSAQVKLDADAAKIKPRTLRRARLRLRVVIDTGADPVTNAFKTYWRLP